MALAVEGLAGLTRAFKLAGVGMEKDLADALKSAGEPVKQTAQGLARSSLREGKTVDWAAMRVGITRHTVYVAPVQRGNRGGSRKRRTLFDRLLGRALEPALQQNEERVEQEVKDAIRDMGRMWERV